MRGNVLFLRDNRGNTFVFSAILFGVLLLFAAMGIDFGYILVAQKQLQGAARSAALAGAVGLAESQSAAINEAVRFAALNHCLGTPVVLYSGDITFPSSTKIKVRAQRTVNTFFLRLAGVHQKTLIGEAAAELAYIRGTTGCSPFCVPNGQWQNGDRVVLKYGTSGETGISPCWYYPVDFPPKNRGNPVTGASVYRNNLVQGTTSYVEVGDILQIEPGNMKGPTAQGVNAILSQDPNARWENGRVVGSIFPGYTSPRILIIPMYDPSNPPSGGKGDVVVNGLGAYFLEGINGNGDVMGVFMNVVANGTRGSEYSLVRKIQLIKE